MLKWPKKIILARKLNFDFPNERNYKVVAFGYAYSNGVDGSMIEKIMHVEMLDSNSMWKMRNEILD